MPLYRQELSYRGKQGVRDLILLYLRYLNTIYLLLSRGDVLMINKQITIRVTPQAANIYESASEQERRKLDALLSLRLSEAAEPNRSIYEIMKEASDEAKSSGLTEDILIEILDER